MNRINITYHVYRSNPLSERTISVTEHISVKDMLAAFCLAMGIPLSCGEVYELEPVDPEEADGRRGLEREIKLDPDLTLAGWLADDHAFPVRGKALVYAGEKTRSLGELTLFFTITERDSLNRKNQKNQKDQKDLKNEKDPKDQKDLKDEKDPKDQKDSKDKKDSKNEKASTEPKEAIPYVLDACGWHLPEGIFRISQVNELWQAFDKYESVEMNGATYIASRLAYDEKKTRGLICSYFAPELAKLLHVEVAAPLRVIIESFKVDQLVSLCDQHRLYYHSRKKADLAALIWKKLSSVEPSQVFEDMTYLEYMKLRRLLLDGPPSLKSAPELDYLFPVLCHYGMVSWTKKAGFLFSKDFIEYYEEWYDTTKEKEYRLNKFLVYVLNTCAAYYGFFSKDMAWQVINQLYPDHVTREDYDAFWKKSNHGKDFGVYICSGGEKAGWAYDLKLWETMDKPMLYFRALAKDDTPRYIPADWEFEFMSLAGHLAPDIEMEELLQTIYYYTDYYHGNVDVPRLCLDCIRMGLSDKEVVRIIMEKCIRYYYRGEVMAQRLLPLVQALRPHVPQVLLYGYMEKQIETDHVPAKARETYARLVEEAAVEEARRKEEAQKRKKEEQKRKKSARKR